MAEIKLSKIDLILHNNFSISEVVESQLWLGLATTEMVSQDRVPVQDVPSGGPCSSREGSTAVAHAAFHITVSIGCFHNSQALAEYSNRIIVWYTLSPKRQWFLWCVFMLCKFVTSFLLNRVLHEWARKQLLGKPVSKPKCDALQASSPYSRK